MIEGVEIKDLRQEHFIPKWYLNGFPKSGLHWVSLMMMPLAKPHVTDHELWGKPWAGTFHGNSWTDNSVLLEKVTYRIGRLPDGHYLKGHSAYSPELERFLWHLGASVIFISRDLRDVAVSKAYHVLTDDDTRWAHPEKDLYRAMGSFEDVLRAVIVGVEGKKATYPGVVDRWHKYAGWLDLDWVCKVRFEDLAEDANEVAKTIIRHGFQRAASVFGLDPIMINENLDVMANLMVQAGQRTDLSPTYRKGEVGNWHDHFTPELARLFAETDTDDWLVRLGYAEDGWHERVQSGQEGAK